MADHSGWKNEVKIKKYLSSIRELVERIDDRDLKKFITDRLDVINDSFNDFIDFLIKEIKSK